MTCDTPSSSSRSINVIWSLGDLSVIVECCHVTLIEHVSAAAAAVRAF